MRMLSVLLSVAVAMSPVLAAAKTIKNSRPASERFLNQAVTAYKKHAKVADVLKHMLPKKRTAADKAYLKKVFGKHMNQVLPKVHHEGNKFWFVLSDKKKVTVEVVNVRQGKFKINGYEARVDFKKKSLKENVNYIGRIIEKDLAKEKTAMERFYRLVFPESHAFVMFGFLITPYAAGVLAAITAGVSGAAYAAYRAFQDEADRFEDHLDDMKVTQASMTCSNPTGSSQQKCRDHIGTEGPAYELKILRDKKTLSVLILNN